MSHAAYVYDIEHVIVDNLQFMTSYLRFVAIILSLVKITVTSSSLFFPCICEYALHAPDGIEMSKKVCENSKKPVCGCLQIPSFNPVS